MKQSQGHLENLGRDARFRQPGLHQLEVIVGELMPGKFVERIDGRAEFETLESAGHDLHHPVEPAQDPAIGRAEARQVGPARRFALQKDKAGSVPELVGEIPIVLDLLLREANVLAAGAEVRAPGARRIRPVGIHHVERIDPGSEGLAHPPSVRGQHGGVDQHVREGDGPHEVQAQEDHPGHPQVDDVAARIEHLGGIEAAQVLRVLRPAERGEWPEPGGEPGVEHVRVLGQRPVATVRTRRRVLKVGDRVAVGAGPDRDPVPKPELTRDAPVPDVAHPAQILLGPSFRMEANLTLLGDVDGRAGKRFHPDPPLGRYQRFDHSAAAVTVPDRVAVGLYFLQRPLGLQHLDDARPRLRHGLAVKLGYLGHVEPAVQVKDAEHLQVLPLTDLIVRGVVAGRHLDRARAEIPLDGLVGHDRHPAMHDRKRDVLPHQASVPGVVRVHGHPGVAHHRLRACRGHADHTPALDRVVEVIEMVICFLVDDLEVRDGAPIAWAPVDDARAAIYQSLLP